MGKIWVEVCLISARGLRRSSSFWKLQWFAVGWIDPNNKYCTKIDASGNSNPVWKTKFAAMVDDSNFPDMMLHVEVYSREPIFLRERLQGSAAVALKEFMAKHGNSSASSKRVGSSTEEVGSYQLRKRNSNKPQGFVDVSIHISEEREDQPVSISSPGNEGRLIHINHSNNNAILSSDGESGNANPAGATTKQPAPAPHPRVRARVRPDSSQSHVNIPYTHHSVPHSPTNYNYNPISLGEPSYRPPRTPPPPPPPSNIGYIPTFLPRTDHYLSGTTYLNIPSSSAAAPPGRGGPGPGFAMGVGAGALAAGAVIFGDDFMSGFDIPAGLQDASLTISTDPPF